MSANATIPSKRYLPQVALATFVVMVLPVAVVYWLYLERVITSYWLCLVLGVALSVIASLLGSAYWKRRRRPEDVLFSELLLWGWLRRLHAERRATNAVRLLGLDNGNGGPQGSTPDVARTARELERLAAALDAQDPYTDGHSRRVAIHAALICRTLRLPREEAAKVQAAATLHDIGKLRIPRELLIKPTELTPAEFELTKQHADEGARIVSFLGDPEIVAMVRHHHERFDGAGYPSGLVGEQAPLGARIIAVADTFDALTSARPYRPATSHKRALLLIARLSGSQLDPAVVRAFLKCYSGKRSAAFWTLLAISPMRAVAFLGETRPVLGVGSPAAMIVGAAAITTVAAAAFGPGAGVAPASYRLGADQQGPLLQAGVEPIPPGLRSSTTPADRRRPTSDPRSRQRPRHTLAARAAAVVPVGFAGGSPGQAPHASHTAPAGTAGGGSTSGSGGAPSSSGGPPTGGSGGGSRGGAGGGSGGGSKGGSGGSSGGSGGGSKGSPGGGSSTGSGSGSGAGSTTGSGGGSSGSGSGATGPSGGSSGGSGGGSGGGGSSGGGSGGGGSGGGQGGGSTGGSGSGSGSGSGGPGKPQTIEDCKNGGWAKYGFSNQGLCVSSVAPNH